MYDEETRAMHGAHVESVRFALGGGGDRQAVITLRNGYVIWIAYGQIGVYARAAFEAGNTDDNAIALWDYVDTDDEYLYPVRAVRTEHTGGGVMVDVVTLQAQQEIWESPVGLTISDDCIVYRRDVETWGDTDTRGDEDENIGGYFGIAYFPD